MLEVSFLYLVCSVLSGEAVPIVTNLAEISEHVTVLEGDNPLDGFAGRVARIGDINGDGADDIGLLSSWAQEDADGVGFILYGTDPLPQNFALAQWNQWGIKIRSAAGQLCPYPTGSIGDIDLDGFDDIPFFPQCGTGEATTAVEGSILLGGRDMPRDIDLSKAGALRRIEVYRDETIKHESIRACTAGDLNGDGIPDLVFGSALSNLEGWSATEGIVHVVFGTVPPPSEIRLTDIGTSLSGCRITAHRSDLLEREGAMLGSRVASGRDLNGDGLDDLAIAAPRWTSEDGNGPERAGAVFVVFGRRTWPSSLDLVTDKDQNMCRLVSEKEKQRLGADTLELIPDATGDGVVDLLISGSGYGEGCYLISGKAIVPGDLSPDEVATTFMTSGGGLVGSGIGDWDGDGIGDIALGSPAADLAQADVRYTGAVYLILGRQTYPRLFPVLGSEAGIVRIAGPSFGAGFGESVFGADLNGDGRPDLVATAPGSRWDPGSEWSERYGRVYIIPGGLDLKGALHGVSFAPKNGSTGGGTTLYIQGRGFDARTTVHFGGLALEVLERPHSRTIVARTPAVEAAGPVEVRLEQAGDSFTFSEPFVYLESEFPREVDVLNLGDKGCTVFEPRFDDWFYYLDTGDIFFENGEDFTGDTLADVTFAYAGETCHPIMHRPYEVYLLHGAPSLPQTIPLDGDISPWVTTIYSADLADGFGCSNYLVGDMNGDGASELAIPSYCGGQVNMHILLGGSIAKGRVCVQDLTASGRAFVIEGLPDTREAQVHGAKIGDFNGDGFSDFAIIILENVEGDEGLVRSTILFVLGRERFPSVISQAALPRLYSRTHSWSSTVHHVKGVGDVDGDGFDDIVLTNSSHADPEVGGDPATCRLYVVFGRANVAPQTTIDMEVESGGACAVTGEGCILPIKVGDPNGDGMADVGFLWSQSGGSGGLLAPYKCFIAYGSLRTSFCRARSSERETDFDIVFTASQNYNGTLVGGTGGGDFNYDGISDIILWDCHQSDAPPPGRAILIFGGDLEEKAGPLESLTDAIDFVNSHSLPRQTDSNDYPGRFDFAGDINGDGYVDLVGYDRARVYIYYNPLAATDPRKPFVRGDVNQDGGIDIADAIKALMYLFGGRLSLPCLDAADTNDDEKLDIADPIYLLGVLFGGGRPIPAPTECGPDPEGDNLGCRESFCGSIRAR